MLVNHIGITVGDLDEGIAWYAAVFDLDVLVGTFHPTARTPGLERRRDIFGSRWGEMKIAHLADEAGVGIELFEFVTPRTEPGEYFEYWKMGVSHVSFTVADIQQAIDRLVSHGGAVKSAVYEMLPGCSVCYCEDPWGTALELSTGTYPATHPSS